MASCFVATEKETRSPSWKSGSKVVIITWSDLESNWSLTFFFFRFLLNLLHPHKLQVQVVDERPDLLVYLRREVLRHCRKRRFSPGIGRPVLADEPVGYVDVIDPVLLSAVLLEEVGHLDAQFREFRGFLAPGVVAVNVREGGD